MISPVRFDLSTINLGSLGSWLAPFPPGLLLVIGMAILRPELVSRYFSISYLGYSTKVALIVVTSYLVGLIVQFAWGFVALGIATALAIVVRLRSSPWRNSLWRKVTKLYLDTGLAPESHEPPCEQ